MNTQQFPKRPLQSLKQDRTQRTPLDGKRTPIHVMDWAAIIAPPTLTEAWRKVRANGGGPGVDGQNLRDFEARLSQNIGELHDELGTGKYEPKPVLKVMVPKASGGRRPLGILTIRDRIIQRAVSDVLTPLYEPKFLDCSYAFRQGRSVRDAVGAIVRLREAGNWWVVDADIKQCFENIDHDILLGLVRREVREPHVLRLIEQWLKARIFNELNSKGVQSGVFQGSVISPLLCNIYLHEFDQALTTAQLGLVRYADDWVIACPSKPEATEALSLATDALAHLKMAVNLYRTDLVTFDDGFTFVGAFFIRKEYFYLSRGMQVAKD